MADLERIRRVRALTDEMGVNLAGAEVALKLMNRIESLEEDLERLTKEVTHLRAKQSVMAKASQSRS
jgi:hypothetical protein